MRPVEAGPCMHRQSKNNPNALFALEEQEEQERSVLNLMAGC
mgnify:CR=1 FL=1